MAQQPWDQRQLPTHPAQRFNYPSGQPQYQQPPTYSQHPPQYQPPTPGQPPSSAPQHQYRQSQPPPQSQAYTPVPNPSPQNQAYTPNPPLYGTGNPYAPVASQPQPGPVPGTPQSQQGTLPGLSAVNALRSPLLPYQQASFGQQGNSSHTGPVGLSSPAPMAPQMPLMRPPPMQAPSALSLPAVENAMNPTSSAGVYTGVVIQCHARVYGHGGDNYNVTDNGDSLHGIWDKASSQLKCDPRFQRIASDVIVERTRRSTRKHCEGIKLSSRTHNIDNVDMAVLIAGKLLRQLSITKWDFLSLAPSKRIRYAWEAGNKNATGMTKSNIASLVRSKALNDTVLRQYIVELDVLHSMVDTQFIHLSQLTGDEQKAEAARNYVDSFLRTALNERKDQPLIPDLQCINYHEVTA